MPFNQATRNRLSSFVSEARSLLSEEFTRQFKQDYGLDPDRGEVTELDKLSHLDDARRETARILRDTLAHYEAGLPSQGARARGEALRRIVREQAFTVLNRLCALRMAEARGLLIESIAKGYQSDGFQLYQKLAGTGLGELSGAYRSYIFSVFDEFAVDLPVLFDRFSPQGRLFPREAVLAQLLDAINHKEIEPLWAEDETIGWIYQYFNSSEERKRMRAESSAPRNSRELAVRNQFFTPRYVVEFLTDNTLGRIWYEMCKGDTVLNEECSYLVRRPNEVFLAPGEEAPAEPENETDHSQEELLKKTVHIEHRPKKDPRDIKILDPACGSGHFLLYAFDLLERIYEEAWADPEGPKSEATGRTLREEYEAVDDLRRAVPKLIMEHNLHGIDIDSRAVQIAALALWLRAQKAWKNLGIKAAERPQVAKSSIVTAEPMPGDEEMRREFTAGLKPQILGQLVDVVFEKMKLAGEAGSLLRIEEDIKDSVAEAKKEWLDAPESEQQLIFPVMADPQPKQQELRFDFTGISDMRFWEQVEDQILDALKDYAERAGNGQTIRRKLFAEDAARGFGFIDLCRKRYDVVLMNPPYGSASEASKEYLARTYPGSWIEIYISFCERSIELARYGLVGTLTSRTFMYLQKFIQFRKTIIGDRILVSLVDLGAGILDSAAVETAAWVFSPAAPKHKVATFINLEKSELKGPDLESLVSEIRGGSIGPLVLLRAVASFDDGSNYSISYSRDVPAQFTIRAGGILYNAKPGLGTRDDFRFARLRWEVPASKLLKTHWACAIYGSQNTKFFADHNMVINWMNDGDEMKSFIAAKYGSASRSIVNENLYFRSGLTYQYTGKDFRVHMLPKECIITMAGQGLYPIDSSDQWALLGILNSTHATVALKEINPGRFFQASYVNSLRLPKSWKRKKNEFELLSQRAYTAQRLLSQVNETSTLFYPQLVGMGDRNTVEYISSINQELGSIIDEIDALSASIFDASNERSGAESADELPTKGSDLSVVIGLIFGRWDIRIARGPSLAPKLPDAFDPLPVCPPGMLVGPNGLPAESDRIVSEEWLSIRPDANTLPPEGTVQNPTIPDLHYPLRISWDGILVEDAGFIGGQSHDEDIVRRVREVLDMLWKDKADEIEQEACEILSVKTFREYFRKPNKFFKDHLKRYSKSRRKAPIYWPLSTASGSYTLWLYYHRLTDQILFTCVNDYLDPKLKQVAEDLQKLKQKGERNREAEREFEYLSDLELELRDLREELLRIAAFWKPNFNDGVQITAAPLWKLFRHEPWQKKLKDTWEKLEAGEYDWAHLAYSVWPDRVREKCESDKSLAIAHEMESIYEGN